MATAIWWIRRDLRLADNPALAAALAQADQVIPLFILDPHLAQAPTTAPARLAFLHDGLRVLDADLRQRGSRLIWQEGPPLAVLTRLTQATGACCIVAQADVSPYARRRDARIGRDLPLQLTGGVTVFPPDAVKKADGTPYTVFTPFSRAWKALPANLALLPAPAHIPTPADLPDLPIPPTPTLGRRPLFPAGEAEVQRRLYRFSAGSAAPILRYDADRHRPDLDGTAQISPYLRFGMISARQAAAAARDLLSAAATPLRGVQTWLDELIWREFYASILYHFPDVLHNAFRSQMHNIPWRDDPAGFQAWCSGRTGYPIVDAAMRQLTQTGWMHNRARMIVASFLVKDLLVDWRLGERFFMQHLLDGDPAANNGGWQWTAGIGTDAAPYFRVFNPVLQARKFDPDGHYVRRWLPALADMPAPLIHEPWLARQSDRRAAGDDYPPPIVEHDAARLRALAAYRHNAPAGDEDVAALPRDRRGRDWDTA